jgi:hypothetical protein
MHAAVTSTKKRFLSQLQVVNYRVDTVVSVEGVTGNLAKFQAAIRKL